MRRSLITLCTTALFAFIAASAAAQAQTARVNQDRWVGFDSPGDITDQLISYSKALELCQSGVRPDNAQPDGLTWSPIGGTGIPQGGSASVDPDFGRACCGNTDWFSADVFYDLGYDDCVDFKIFFFFDRFNRRLTSVPEGLPLSFRLDTLWDQSEPARTKTVEIVHLTSDEFSVQDENGNEYGRLPAIDGHWYEALFKLNMPAAAGQSADLHVWIADHGADGATGGAFVDTNIFIDGDELANAMCVMPFVQVREWAGVRNIDNILLQSALLRTSFESGDLGLRFVESE